MWRARRSQRRRRQPPTPEGALGALATEIQDDVLARLPARDVVRMSMLSPAWRRRWESVRALDVDLDGVRSWETAAGVLERCTDPVRRVRIRGIPLGLAGRADSWLRLVAGKRPRSVCLDLPARDPPAALPSLFSCDPAALAELRLRSCALPAPPVGFAGFHALAALSLDGVLFPAENGWSIPGKWVIGGPNLRRLVLCLRLAGAGSWELGELPKLEDANVTLNEAPVDKDYGKLFRAVSSVRELKLDSFRAAEISEDENEMRFIQHVLHRARNLQAVSVDMFEGSGKSAQEASRELKECQRASPAAGISIKHGDSIEGTLMAPPKGSHWSKKTNRHWIMFHDVNGLTIAGGGTIDGKWQDLVAKFMQN
ncbi:hypothetical protein C2845_PM15G16690 [Panicum miliaceum]|uniref:F-box domain-containing protein n=1 Tax=Panicum miliaceum TaxID=4540 RepID=A0A3L6Q4R7_PANMI|nr:hypothetical protein C2845_PM15G16690 [Panicum miliaceum]